MLNASRLCAQRVVVIRKGYPLRSNTIVVHRKHQNTSTPICMGTNTAAENPIQIFALDLRRYLSSIFSHAPNANTAPESIGL